MAGVRCAIIATGAVLLAGCSVSWRVDAAMPGKAREQACSLIEFAVIDAALTADWYLDAHKFLRAHCRDKETTRAALEKFCAAVMDGGEPEPRVCKTLKDKP